MVSNRDQVITWIPDRDLFVNEDQPCMQRHQFFTYEYPRENKTYESSSDNVLYEHYDESFKGKAEFHVSWRSRDLFNAWNTNMIALIKC